MLLISLKSLCSSIIIFPSLCYFFAFISLNWKSVMKLWITGSLILCSVIKEALGKSTHRQRGRIHVNAGGHLPLRHHLPKRAHGERLGLGKQSWCPQAEGIARLSPGGFSVSALVFSQTNLPPGKHFFSGLSILSASVLLIHEIPLEPTTHPFGLHPIHVHYFKLEKGHFSRIWLCPVPIASAKGGQSHTTPQSPIPLIFKEQTSWKKCC